MRRLAPLSWFVLFLVAAVLVAGVSVVLGQ